MPVHHGEVVGHPVHNGRRRERVALPGAALRNEVSGDAVHRRDHIEELGKAVEGRRRRALLTTNRSGAIS